MADGLPDSTLAPLGQDGSPVPAGVSVTRLGAEPPLKNLNDPGHALLRGGKAWPGLFAFNSKEREMEATGLKPRLSVWLQGYTTVAQAWVLVGGKSSCRIVLTLSVEHIRQISAAATNDSPRDPLS